MHVDLTLFTEVMSLIVLYYLALFTIGARGVRNPIPAADQPLIVIVVPAHNEELVIQSTLASALTSDYDGAIRVLLMDDASTDRTGIIADRMASRDYRLRVVHRSIEVGGR